MSEHYSYNGIGFTGLLTLLFIAFKILGVVDWSWWWVLSPIWISIGVLISIIFIIFIVVFINEVSK